MQGPLNFLPPPDLGAKALQDMAQLGEAGTMAAAQLLNGLSGMLVSTALTGLIRDLLGSDGGHKSNPPKPAQGAKNLGETDRPEPDHPAAAGANEGEEAPPATGTGAGELADLGANALKEMVVQGLVGRVLALNTVNTYLSLAAAEQLHKWGEGLGAGAGKAGQPSAPSGAIPQAWAGPTGWGLAPGGGQPFGGTLPVGGTIPPGGAPPLGTANAMGGLGLPSTGGYRPPMGKPWSPYGPQSAF